MNVPKNVWWFEVLLYASLVLDALSVAFQDRTPSPRMTESMIGVSTLLALGLLVLLFYFVWLAARRARRSRTAERAAPAPAGSRRRSSTPSSAETACGPGTP